MPRNIAHIVQLPFPSSSAPHEQVVDYYREYSRQFSQLIDNYFVPEGSLWEMPLWVAHFTGMLDHIGYTPNFSDLSRTTPSVEECTKHLLSSTRAEDVVMFSPLAQNFELAIGVSRNLIDNRRKTILGGNMSSLADDHDATVIHHGQATPQSLQSSLVNGRATLTNILDRGDNANWLPDYRLLASYRGKVPLLRLNASHGCLFRCDFCGDAWSNKLNVVPPSVLEYEVRQFERLFPDTRLIYIGDKTFGQSKEAVQNLLDVFSDRPDFRFIVQTHVMAISSELLDAMERLGVVVVEMGFESAADDLMKQNHKGNRTLDFYLEKMSLISERNMRLVLNILSGLPTEDRNAHEQTVSFINNAPAEAWLFNLYNFVPYPLTPYFPKLRDRIIDWNFSHWREDFPPVFQPYHCTVDESYDFFLEKLGAAQDTITRAERTRFMTHLHEPTFDLQR